VSLRLEMRPFRLPLRAPLRTAHGQSVAVEGLRLLLRDAEGSVGLGEVTPLPDFGTETLEAAVRALGSLRLGPVPSTVEDVANAFSCVPSAPATRSGVEMAFLDLLARRQGVALARLLGASTIRGVEVNALLRGETPLEVAQEAKDAMAAGFRTLKVKMGSHPEALDTRRLRAVREAVGPSVRLRVDANGAWTEAEARVRLAPLLALGLEYAEQPVPPGDISGLRRLRALLRVAADEALGTEEAAAALLDGVEGPAADVLVLKLPVLGGILPALRLAARARVLGVGTVVTSAMDGAVGRAAGAHLALTLGGGWAHGLATGLLLLEDPGAHPVVAGALQLRDEPGLGIAPEALGW
jgi:o-succinylbenzoate synthase